MNNDNLFIELVKIQLYFDNASSNVEMSICEQTSFLELRVMNGELYTISLETTCWNQSWKLFLGIIHWNSLNTDLIADANYLFRNDDIVQEKHQYSITFC